MRINFRKSNQFKKFIGIFIIVAILLGIVSYGINYFLGSLTVIILLLLIIVDLVVDIGMARPARIQLLTADKLVKFSQFVLENLNNLRNKISHSIYVELSHHHTKHLKHLSNK